MKGRNRFSISMDELAHNQFLSDAANKGMSSRVFSKDSRVQKLQERNVKLQNEIIRIEQTLANSQEKSRYGIRLPEIKTEVIQRELANAYKMIKQYEYEINKKKKIGSEDNYVEHLRKCEQILKQKEQVAEKLRKEIAQTKKRSVDLVKLLKNDSLKKDHAQKQATISKDIKWIHEQIKKMETKNKIESTNLQKQNTQIQKMQAQLVKNHQYERQALEIMRNKIFNATETASIGPLTHISKVQSDQQLEHAQMSDRLLLNGKTPQNYAILLAEVNLYKKLEKDYEGKIELLIKEKQQAEDRNFMSRNKLVQTEYEIENTQSAIEELKKQIDPRALKPTKLSLIKEEEKRKHSSSVKLNKPKITMTHNFRFNEVGEATKAGKRFIDSTAIGKRPAKIVGITFYQKKEGQNELVGLQAMYMIGDTKKKGLLNVLMSIEQVQKNEYTLQQGDFVRSVDVMTSDKGKVVGVSLVSNNHVILKGGTMTINRVSIKMQPNEYPVCIYGCLLPGGLQMLGCQFVNQ